MTALDDGGCVNCGIIDVPMNVEGYCHGCTCLNCGMGGTMTTPVAVEALGPQTNAAGWCDGCENVLVAYYPPTSSCFPEVVKP
jgi:hypothetical protein